MSGVTSVSDHENISPHKNVYIRNSIVRSQAFRRRHFVDSAYNVYIKETHATPFLKHSYLLTAILHSFYKGRLGLHNML